MQTVGPYRLLHALGTCQVGDVWSAVDAINNHVTVAVLSPDAARDPGWRNAFAAAANGLSESGQVLIIASDFFAQTPWVASVSDDGSEVAQVYLALGMVYHPLPAEPGDEIGPEQPPPEPVPPEPVPPLPEPAPPEPAPPPPAVDETQPVPVPPQPVSAPPQPVSAPPQPVSAPPQPISGAPPPYRPLPVGPPPVEPSRHRTALLIGSLLLVVLVLGGGGGAIAFALRSDGGEPEAAPTTSPTPPPPVRQPPSQPGIEPPVDGGWPADWLVFEPQERVTPMTDLAGLGFSFEAPEGWECSSITNGADFAHYTCGPAGGGDEIGGDLIVRTCLDPCDGDRRVEMRMAEEAWRLQWVRDGGYLAWAETARIDGEPRYGLVFVGYWRSTSEGRLDRQLVFRMTAPVEDADEIRKTASSVRSAIR